MSANPSSLRRTLTQGSAALVGREGAGVLLSLVAVTVVFRHVGPSGYALVAVALTLSAFLGRVGALGLDTYIARHPGPLPDGLTGRLLAVAVCAATCAAGALAGAAIPIERALDLPGAAAVTLAVASYLWLFVVSRIPVAALEHALRFKALALVEFSSLVVYTVLAVAFALAGAGVWSIVVGTVAQGATVFGLAFWLEPIRPTAAMFHPTVRAALKYGLPYQLSVWLWSIRDLVGPFVVGWLLGAAEIGVLAGATLMAARAGFIRPIVWRVSLAGFGKLQGDPARLRRAVSLGMVYQLLALGTFVTAFALAAPWAVPVLLGAAWADVATLFPLIAIGLLGNAVFSLHCSSLFAAGSILAMTWFHAAHVVTLTVAAVALVDAWGLIGYGLAEVVALWTYVLPHRAFTRSIGRVQYSVPLLVGGLTLTTLGTLALAGFAPGVVVALASLAVLAMLPTVRATAASVVDSFRPDRAPNVEVAAR